jgi:hypothetical protein
MISVENRVDDQVRKGEEQRRYPPGMLLEFVSLEKTIKHQARIGKSTLGRKVGSRHRTRIRSTSLAQGGDQGIVERPICGPVCISDATVRRCTVAGDLQWIRSQVIARRVRKIVVD